MGYIETKRCRNLRRVLIALFIVCGYMLSTTFAGAYLDVKGKETFVTMTAINLALGSPGSDTPVYQNAFFGGMYIAIPFIGFFFMFFDKNIKKNPIKGIAIYIPFIGFFFMFFDKKSNVKNLAGVILGIVGCLGIALPLGMSEKLYLGIGAMVSMILYVIIAMLSAVSILFVLEDKQKDSKNGKRLSKGL